MTKPNTTPKFALAAPISRGVVSGLIADPATAAPKTKDPNPAKNPRRSTDLLGAGAVMLRETLARA